jgi:DHA1 family quinolone resistance protein-like MFS transporter
MKKHFKLNKVLNVLISTNFVMDSSYGLLAPVLAVFLTDQISGGNLIVVGIAEAIYLLTKSGLQVPFGIMIDKTEGQKIDFWFLFSGSLIMSVTLFFYLFSSLPWHIYLISAVYGIGEALAYPAWTGLFTRNIVKYRESFAWSFSTTVSELGAAGAALMGGIIAEYFGFAPLFMVVGGLSLVGTFLLFFFYKDLKDS